MKNKKLWFVIITMILILGILLVSCNTTRISTRIPEEPLFIDLGDFSMTITEAYIISQVGIEHSGYFPDGKISVLKDNETGRYITFWAEFISYRTVADTPYPEDHISQIRPRNRVYGRSFDQQAGFNDGGSWFIGVHKLRDGRLAGFFHAESHWPGQAEAYKSVGVSYSSDNGRTWTKGEKILNVNYPKPERPRWSGLGDGCVVYNEEKEQFILYYSADAGGIHRICMAASSDPAGASGTWKKWDGSDFTIDGYDNITGLGGRDTQISGLQSRPGANPSVHWNTHLQKWVMVYHGWSPRVVYISFSEDGLVWERPVGITNPINETAWYPNLIGSDGDTVGGATMKLYYSRNMNLSTGVRQMAMRTITFH